MSKLCRFCKCPVAEGGVLLSEVDRDALSSWWSKCLHTELDAETLKDAWSCRQCVADARFLHENSDGDLDLDVVWWPLEDIFYKYYDEHQLKCPTVTLKELGESDFEDLGVKVDKICCEFCDEEFFIPENLDLHVKRNHPSAPSNQIFQCLFCSKLYNTKRNLKSHLKLLHKDEGVRCKFKNCATAFRTTESLEEHLKTSHFLTADGKNKFKCKVCKYWYASKLYLNIHVKSHARKEQVASSKTFECIYCLEKFTSRKYLNQHTIENHKSEAIKCRVHQCKLYFKSTEKMKDHFENAHKNNCKFCTSYFINSKLFSSHLRKVHPDKKCNFSRCVFYSDCKKELEKHVKEKHSKNDKLTLADCVFCGKSYTNREHLGKHVRRVHSEIAIRCDQFKCCTYFKSQEDMEEHKIEVHQRVEKYSKSVICLFCQRTYENTNSYATHIKTLHAGEAVRCKYRNCFTFLKSEDELQKHYEEKHVVKLCCALCDYKTSKKYNLRSHFQIYHLPKEFKCPQCPKLFGNNSCLTAHLNNYHKSKKCPHCNEMKKILMQHLVTTFCPICFQPFPCKKLLIDHKLKCKKVHECRECGETFKIEGQLKRHFNLKHKSGQKWRGYKCKFCKAVCENTKSLKSHHMSEHFNMMKYKCEFCEKAFLFRESYRHHIVAAHNIGDFACKFCSRKFFRKRLLYLHLMQKHFKQTGPEFGFVECDDCGKVMKKSNLSNHFVRDHF